MEDMASNSGSYLACVGAGAAVKTSKGSVFKPLISKLTSECRVKTKEPNAACIRLGLMAAASPKVWRDVYVVGGAGISEKGSDEIAFAACFAGNDDACKALKGNCDGDDEYACNLIAAGCYISKGAGTIDFCSYLKTGCEKSPGWPKNSIDGTEASCDKLNTLCYHAKDVSADDVEKSACGEYQKQCYPTDSYKYCVAYSQVCSMGDSGSCDWLEGQCSGGDDNRAACAGYSNVGRQESKYHNQDRANSFLNNQCCWKLNNKACALTPPDTRSKVCPAHLSTLGTIVTAAAAIVGVILAGVVLERLTKGRGKVKELASKDDAEPETSSSKDEFVSGSGQGSQGSEDSLFESISGADKFEMRTQIQRQIVDRDMTRNDFLQEIKSLSVKVERAKLKREQGEEVDEAELEANEVKLDAATEAMSDPETHFYEDA